MATAVVIKLSTRDAGYLIQMLDAVAAASQQQQFVATRCGDCLDVAGEDGLGKECKACRGFGTKFHSAQSLQNAGPFGDFKSNRTFALRIGATVLSAKNIADADDEY